MKSKTTKLKGVFKKPNLSQSRKERKEKHFLKQV